jgi:hypothetical protein
LSTLSERPLKSDENREPGIERSFR